MKIVHLVLDGEIAGGQVVALRLARAARDRGYEVELVSPSPGPFVDRAAGEGFTVHVLPVRGALDVGAMIRLRGLLRRRRADVLHTHAHFAVNTVGRVAGRLARVRVISHMHAENVFRAGGGRGAQRALDRLTARLCNRIVAVSAATRASLLEQGYPAVRTVVVRNGVEADGQAAPERLTAAPELLHVGRLDPGKGQRELIQALPRLERQDAVAVLVGSDVEAGGAYEQELGRVAGELGVGERVVFAGGREDVGALLAGCDVFVLPSWVEGLPLVLLEAMAQAKPVVATAVGGIPEVVVDGETGLLVPPHDVAALARALDTLLGDPDRARRLGESGLRRVRSEFSADAAAERVLRLYEDAT